MFCIVGLGNPEPRYEGTRHNIGFSVADRIAGLLNGSFRSGKGEYVYADTRYAGRKLLLVKPTTYMNRSGFAVREVVDYFKLDFEHVLVILDDLDLPFGTIRIRPHGGDAGNKGLRSIIEQTSTHDIPRMRIGIRNRDTISNASSYVLSGFNRDEKKHIPLLLDTADDAVRCWIDHGIDTAMNRYNRQIEFT